MKPRVVSGLRPYRLYKVETAAAIFRETGKTQATAFAVVALVVGGTVFGAHIEEPLLASFAGACDDARYLSGCEYPPLFDWLAGLLGLTVTAVYCAVLLTFRRAAPPTVYCEGCDGAGWVRDLEPTHGSCPYCRYDRFTYFARSVPTADALLFSTLVESQMTGRALIDRYRAQTWRDRLRHPWR